MKNTGAMPSSMPAVVAGSDPLTGKITCTCKIFSNYCSKIVLVVTENFVTISTDAMHVVEMVSKIVSPCVYLWCYVFC